MSVNAAAEAGKFTLQHLTLSINKAKTAKRVLAQLGIFEEKGIQTQTADFEFKDGKLMLVAQKTRGEKGDKLQKTTRDVKTLRAVHLPISGEIMADALTDVRKFGAEYDNGNSGERWDEVVNEETTRMAQSLELTLEMHRMGALSGVVKDASGDTIVDLYALFGLKAADAIDELDFNLPRLSSQKRFRPPLLITSSRSNWPLPWRWTMPPRWSPCVLVLVSLLLYPSS